jgi:hypothetical protein
VTLTDDEKKKLMRGVDVSGFPLQLRVEHEIRGLRESSFQWDLLKPEVPWNDPVSGRSGAVDLLVKKARLFLVIECKRRWGEGINWTFLIGKTASPRNRIRFCYAEHGAIRATDGNLTPASPRASYCVAPGSGDKFRRSVDRVASELALATECIAAEYAGLNDPAARFPAAFVPMIVCVPSPALARIDVGEIELASGRIGGEEESQLEIVPFIRFHKAFITRDRYEPNTSRSLEKVIEDRERTVLIVHAEALSQTLSAMQLDAYDED